MGIYAIPEAAGAAASSHTHGTVNLAGTNISASATSVSSGLSLALSVDDYLTTAAASDHTHGAVSLAVTNMTASASSASSGFTLSLEVGSGLGDGGIFLSAGTESQSTGLVTIADSNGISWGLSAGILTGSVVAGAATDHTHTEYAGTAGAITGGSITVNTSGISVDLPAYLTTAAESDHTHSQYLTTAALSDHTHSQYLTTAALSDHTHSQYLTTAALSDHTHSQYLTTAALSDHSHGNPTLALTNLTGTTASASNGFTISLSAAAAGPGGGIAISAGTASQDEGTIVFSNSNGVSFGLDGSTVTASHNGLTTAAASDHSHGNPTLALTNLTGTTASASNGFTLSLSAGAGGAEATLNGWLRDASYEVKTISAAEAWVFVRPYPLEHNVAFSGAGIPVYASWAANSTGTVTIRVELGVYTDNASTLSLSMSTFFQDTITMSGNNATSSSYRGFRMVPFNWTQTLTSGNYYIGLWSSRTTSGGANVLSFSFLGMTQAGTAYSGWFGSASNTSINSVLGQGLWAGGTTDALPSAMNLTSISGTGTQGNIPIPVLLYSNLF